jgi:hypothetical protein
MAQEKEPFLERWSRLKQERPEEKEEKKALAPAPQLPPVESLAPGSEEFKSFMHPQVEDALRRAALKKLFSDAHFNVPDPFEPYSGDWSVAEPIPQEMLKQLAHAKEVLFGEEEERKRAAERERLAQEETEEGNATDEPGRQDT